MGELQGGAFIGIKRGAAEPAKAKCPLKLDRFVALINAKVEHGLSPIQIFQNLSKEPVIESSYPGPEARVHPPAVGLSEVYCRMWFAPGGDRITPSPPGG